MRDRGPLCQHRSRLLLQPEGRNTKNLDLMHNDNDVSAPEGLSPQYYKVNGSKVRALIGKQWCPVTWDGEIWVNALENLESRHSSEPPESTEKPHYSLLRDRAPLGLKTIQKPLPRETVRSPVCIYAHLTSWLPDQWLGLNHSETQLWTF